MAHNRRPSRDNAGLARNIGCPFARSAISLRRGAAQVPSANLVAQGARAADDAARDGDDRKTLQSARQARGYGPKGE